MAVLSKCVVGSSLVQLALGTEEAEEVTLSKLSDITPQNWADVQHGTLTVGSKNITGMDLSEIMEKHGTENKYVLKNSNGSDVCGKFREFKDGAFKSNSKQINGKDTVYLIDFAKFTVDDQNHVLAYHWDECMWKFAKDQWGEATAKEIVEGTESKIEFIDDVYEKLANDKREDAFKNVFGRRIQTWAEERASQTITHEQYEDIDNSTQTNLWTDGVKTRIFQKIVLSKLFAPPADPAPAGSAASPKQGTTEDKNTTSTANTDPVEIDIMKSKGLLALLVSGLFMTACNFAWNVYYYIMESKLKESPNEEDDSTDPESDE